MSTEPSTFELAADSTSLPPFRKKLKSLLEKAAFDEKTVHNILLSVDEVLTNVIRHAYCPACQNRKEKIHVSIFEHENRIEILIEDKGPCFDPRTIPPPKLPSEKPGGLGIYLVRTLMDEIDHEALKPQGNRLRLVKYKEKMKGI